MFEDLQSPLNQECEEDTRTESQIGVDCLDAIHNSLLEVKNFIEKRREELNTKKGVVQRQSKNIKDLQMECEQFHVKIDRLNQVKEIALEKNEDALKKCYSLQYEQIGINALVDKALKNYEDSMVCMTNSQERFRRFCEIESERRAIYRSVIEDITLKGDRAVSHLRHFLEDKKKLAAFAETRLQEVNKSVTDVEVVKLNQRINEMELYKKELQSNIVKLEDDCKVINKENLELEQQTRSENVKISTSFDTIVSLLNTENAKIESDNEKLRQCNYRIEELRTKQEDLENQILLEESFIRSNTEDLEAKHIEIDRVNLEINNLNVTMPNLQATCSNINEIRQKIENNEKKIQTCKKNIDENKNEIMELEKSIGERKFNVDVINEELKSINFRNSVLQENISSLNTQIEQSHMNTELLKKSLAEYEALTKKLEGKKQANKDLKKIIDSHQRTLDEIQFDTSKLMKTHHMKQDLIKKENEKIEKIKKCIDIRNWELCMETVCIDEMYTRTLKEYELKLSTFALVKEKIDETKRVEEEIQQIQEEFKTEKKTLNEGFTKKLEDKLQEFKELQKDMENELETKNEEFVNSRDDYNNLKSDVEALEKFLHNVHLQKQKFESEEIMFSMFVKWVKEDETSSQWISQELGGTRAIEGMENLIESEEDIITSDVSGDEDEDLRNKSHEMEGHAQAELLEPDVIVTHTPYTFLLSDTSEGSGTSKGIAMSTPVNVTKDSPKKKSSLRKRKAPTGGFSP